MSTENVSAQTLQNQIAEGYYLGGTQNPSIIPQYGYRGAIWILIGRTPTDPIAMYRKLDNGCTVNWEKLEFFGGEDNIIDVIPANDFKEIDLGTYLDFYSREYLVTLFQGSRFKSFNLRISRTPNFLRDVVYSKISDNLGMELSVIDSGSNIIARFVNPNGFAVNVDMDLVSKKI